MSGPPANSGRDTEERPRNSQVLTSVMLTRCSENMRLLRERYYYVTWKADGTRYMMLILREGAYLIDRNFAFRRAQVRFPAAVRRLLTSFLFFESVLLVLPYSPFLLVQGSCVERMWLLEWCFAKIATVSEHVLVTAIQ